MALPAPNQVHRKQQQVEFSRETAEKKNNSRAKTYKNQIVSSLKGTSNRDLFELIVWSCGMTTSEWNFIRIFWCDLSVNFQCTTWRMCSLQVRRHGTTYHFRQVCWRCLLPQRCSRHRSSGSGYRIEFRSHLSTESAFGQAKSSKGNATSIWMKFRKSIDLLY